MKEKKKKIILIFLIILGMLLSLLSLGSSILLKNYDFSEETIDQVAEVYDGMFTREELEAQLTNGASIVLKLAITKIIVQTILLISVIKGPNKNRVALIYLSIINFILCLPFVIGALAILIISSLKSKDIPYEKPTPPEVTEVQTFKLPVYIVFFLLIWLFLYNGLLTKIFPAIKEFGEAHIMPFEVGFFLSLLLIVVVLLRKEIVRDFKLLINNYGKYHSIITRGFFWIMLLNIGTGLIARKMTGTTSDNQATLNELPLWFMAIFGSIIGPFVEEGVYRGFLGKIIKNKVAFIIASSILFAAMHVVTIATQPENPAQYWFLLQYGVMGLVLSINYTRTKNIFTSTMIHILMNGTATALAALVLL